MDDQFQGITRNDHLGRELNPGQTIAKSLPGYTYATIVALEYTWLAIESWPYISPYYVEKDWGAAIVALIFTLTLPIALWIIFRQARAKRQSRWIFLTACAHALPGVAIVLFVAAANLAKVSGW